MRLFHRLPSLLLLLVANVSASFSPRSPENPNQLQESEAYSILKNLPDAKPYCSTLTYSHDPITTTKTVKVSQTASTCKTEIVKSIDFETKTKTRSTTVPQITKTSYSSTVLVPTGTAPVVDKRNPVAATASPLAKYPPSVLCKACSSLYPRSTITKTVTSTKTIKCTTTETTVKTKYIATTTETLSIFPPAITVAGTGVLTTTVPAACAETPFDVGGDLPPGTEVNFPQYPDYPGTVIECCVSCARLKNCVASAFDSEVNECELLVVDAAQASGKSRQCPLGVADFAFGDPDPAGSILPGPCGK